MLSSHLPPAWETTAVGPDAHGAAVMSWQIVAVAVATPILAFLGATLGAFVARKGARELDTWRHREETMRLLRWAVEQVASDSDPSMSSA